MKNIRKTHLEKFAEILYYVVNDVDETEGVKQFHKTKLKNNTLFLIDYINQHSSTFFLQGMNLKNDLHNCNEKIKHLHENYNMDFDRYYCNSVFYSI